MSISYNDVFFSVFHEQLRKNLVKLTIDNCMFYNTNEYRYSDACHDYVYYFYLNFHSTKF